MRNLALAFAAACACACALIQNPEDPRCAHTALAQIEAEYIAEISEACAGYTFEACPARPAIDARFDARRERWVRCDFAK